MDYTSQIPFILTTPPDSSSSIGNVAISGNNSRRSSYDIKAGNGMPYQPISPLSHSPNLHAQTSSANSSELFFNNYISTTDLLNNHASNSLGSLSQPERKIKTLSTQPISMSTLAVPVPNMFPLPSPPPGSPNHIPTSMNRRSSPNLTPSLSASLIATPQSIDEKLTKLQRKRHCEAAARYRRKKQEESIELKKKVAQLTAEVEIYKSKIALMEGQNVNMKRRLRGLDVDVELEFPDITVAPESEGDGDSGNTPEEGS
ncbi:hypothetical protein BKA69DRAFT_1042552 [Paraphysoderma sedebokerense]|nr:hypothetical protein BKA69DRAFT_1042552 [Paraphysoderma sedebokerense]